MNDDALINALIQYPGQVTEDILHDTKQFLAAIEMAAQSKLEESVPVEMMQMFTDEQWIELILEFQPGATLFGSNFDIASMHQSWMETTEVQIPPAAEPYYWLIFADQEGLVVRLLNPQEFQALEMAANSASFSAMATALWPELSVDEAHHEMTEMLLVWLNDGLIIDAGVPLPEDAIFEGE